MKQNLKTKTTTSTKKPCPDATILEIFSKEGETQLRIWSGANKLNSEIQRGKKSA